MGHGGRTNSAGCHNDRKNGGYHCHGTSSSSTYNSSPKIKSLTSSTAPNKSVSSELVLQIQKYLNLLGYDAGKEDGLTGSKTKEAIKAFQNNINEAEDGTPSYVLLDKLSKAAND
jgi:peptidoglycan hydrolase-like protein with peptidoglycan-binding domain